jgi:protein-S-isoprenylcysteine O-methyltransferase Ste14
MLIIGLNEIMSAWYNDAHIITAVIFLLFSPLLIQFIRKKYFEAYPEYLKTLTGKNIFFIIADSNIEILTGLNLLLYFTGLTGFFQLVIPYPLLEGLIRSGGIGLYILTLIFLFVYYRNYFHVDRISIDKIGFFKIVRHPEELLIFLLCISLALQTLNLLILFITLFFLLPAILIRLKNIEKPLILSDSFYLDYASEVPLLFPDIIRVIRLLFF